MNKKSRIFQRVEYHNRVKSDEKQGNQNMQWIDYNFECLLIDTSYNHRLVHSADMTTQFKNKGQYDTPSNQNTRKTKVSQGDQVRIYITEKERTSQWSKENS